MPLNRYTNNFRTPIETDVITGSSPTFGSNDPVLDINAAKLDINGSELNVISRNINFSHTTGLTTFSGQVGIGTTLSSIPNLSTKLEIYGGGGDVVFGTLFDTTTALYLNASPGVGWTDYNLASSAARNLIINRPSTNQILFSQGNSTHAAFNSSNYLILSDGGLGLGADNTGSEYLLYVNGTSAFIGTVRLQNNPTGVGFGTTTFNPPYAIQQTMGVDDGWRIYGESLVANTGSLIIEVNDDVDGSEDIQFRNRRDFGTNVGVSTFLRLGQSANIMNSGAPLLIGTATSTGTVDQRLQVTGGAYVSGAVGIGTTNPQYETHLYGNKSGDVAFVVSNKLSGTTNARTFIGLENEVGGQGSIAFGSTSYTASGPFRPSGLAVYTSGTNSSGGIAIAARNTAGYIDFYTGGNNQRAIIDASGNVGIGTTNPLTRLQINPAGTSAVVITSSGLVGIGTTNPTQLLEILGGESKFGRVNNTQEGGQINFGRPSDNTTVYSIDAYSDVSAGSTTRLRFIDAVAGLERMTLDRTNLLIGTATSTGTTNQFLQVNSGAYIGGNLGVNKTSPVGALDVVGFATISNGAVILGTGVTIGLGATASLQANSTLTFVLTSNTNLRVSVRGTDGVIRFSNITLA